MTSRKSNGYWTKENAIQETRASIEKFGEGKFGYAKIQGNGYGGPAAAMRKPQRLTATVPHRVFEELVELSAEEGRSLSNLAAYLLELALSQVRRQRQVAQQKRS